MQCKSHGCFILCFLNLCCDFVLVYYQCALLFFFLSCLVQHPLPAGILRLSSLSSQDSGFTSQDMLFPRPASMHAVQVLHAITFVYCKNNISALNCVLGNTAITVGEFLVSFVLNQFMLYIGEHMFMLKYCQVTTCTTTTCGTFSCLCHQGMTSSPEDDRRGP